MDRWNKLETSDSRTPLGPSLKQRISLYHRQNRVLFPFATLVTTDSKDEFLAMRLIRDSVPGLSSWYIKYPIGQLADALKKYSPVILAGESEKSAESRDCN